MRPWMIRLSFATLLIAAPGLVVAQGVAGEVAATRDSGDAAHLFYYRPHDREAFDAGYRAHLAWHREHRDPLVWYGWYVYDGPRVGLFVNGSFGAPLAAFDSRVDIAEDVADGDRNVNPHAETVTRSSYRLRRELSTGAPLEHWEPTARVQVFHVRLRPGRSAAFEALLRALQGRLAAEPAAPPFTWYERLTGGPVPEFLLMIARQGWQDYDRYGAGLEDLVVDPGQRETLAEAIEGVEAETWIYRTDLSLIPGTPAD